MKATERISKGILKDIRCNTPMGSNSEFTDEQINNKSSRELLDHWLQWNGIIGFTGSIIEVVEQVYAVKLPKGK